MDVVTRVLKQMLSGGRRENSPENTGHSDRRVVEMGIGEGGDKISFHNDLRPFCSIRDQSENQTHQEPRRGVDGRGEARTWSLAGCWRATDDIDAPTGQSTPRGHGGREQVNTSRKERRKEGESTKNKATGPSRLVASTDCSTQPGPGDGGLR